MSLRLIYGRSGTGKSEYCYKEISKIVNEESKIYIITPEQFSFTAEKKLVDTIENGAVVNAEVLTFHRMAHRVINEVGGKTKTSLSECGKAMLISSILTKRKKDLKFLGKTEENVKLLENQITEFKKHNITIENLNELIENEEDKYLQAKLKDVFLVYQEFQNTIQNKYIDENDLLSILAEQLESSNMFNNTVIYIDEFVGFTKQEYEIIRHLLKVAKQVNITICTDNFEHFQMPETDLFYSNKETKDKLIEIAQNEKIKIENGVFLQNTYRFKTNELKHLEKNLYSIPYYQYEKDTENIKMFLAKNQYSEIEYIANQIVHLVRDEGYRYKDISVITKNIETYSSLVKAIFNKYNIPVFIDEKKDLSQNILVKYLISVIEIYSQNWTTEAIMNYLKIGLIDEIEPYEIYQLENYCSKWGIKGKKWYEGEWKFGEVTEKNKDQIERIKEIRKIIIRPLLELKQELEKNKTAEQTTKSLYDFLIKNKIDIKLEKRINQLIEEGNTQIAKEYETSWKTIIQVLDEIVLIFKDDKMNYDKYIQLLKVGLNTSGLGQIPGTQDQVIVGDIDRSRSHKVKAIFIIGLNDGVFPSVNKNEGFFNDDDRSNLKEKGIELAKGSIELLYEENFNIYKAFTTAEEKLYLTYASSDSAGAALRKSILVTKIKKIYPKLIEESDVITHKSEIATEETTFDELLINLQKFREGNKIDEIWFDVYRYYIDNPNWKYKLKNALEGLRYTNIPKKISEKSIENLYGNKLITSVSKLEKYRQCAFSYYLKYGLRLEEKAEFKVESFQTGSFMHDVIENFFNIIKERNIKLEELTESDLERLVEEIINEKLNLDKNYIFNSVAKYKVMANRLKKVVFKSIKYLVEGLIKSDFEVAGNEIEFGENKTYEPIKFKLEDGKEVELIGKIDRVDFAKTEEGKYVRIIDYKSSVKKIDYDKVYAGIQIQLLTYLDAVCKVENVLPAGVLYYNLINPIISNNKKLTPEQLEIEIKKKYKMQGILLDDIKVIRMMDNTLNPAQGNKESYIISAKLTDEGELAKTTKGVKSQDFEYLQRYTNKLIKQIAKEIYSGNIDLKPYKKREENACTYCSYKTICQFNSTLCGNEYNNITKGNQDIILEMIREDLQDR